jgi:Domain of unknown function (DUF4335)
MSNLLSLMNGSRHLRYTPPTCTLEIKAQSSPLARWTNRPLLKQLNFKLSFDDPRLPPDRQVTIQGDRAQLELLYNAVTNYVQQLLQQSPAQLSAHYFQAADSTTDRTTQANGNNLAVLSEVWDEQEALDLPADLLADLPARSPNSSSVVMLPTASIYLKSSGFVSHQLFLGPLATETSGPFVQLGTLQLFDLATALDEYAAEVMALPQLEASEPQPYHPALWAGAGAAATLLAVGVTATLLRLQQQPATIATQTVSHSPTQSQGVPIAPSPLSGPPPPVSPRVATPTPTPSPAAKTDAATKSAETPPVEKVTPPPPVNPTPIPIPSDAPSQPADGRSSQSIAVPGGGASPANPGGTNAPPNSDPPPVAAPLPPVAAPPPPAAYPQPIAPTAPTDRNPGLPNFASEDMPDAAVQGEASLGETRPNSRFTPSAPDPQGTAFDVTPQVAKVRQYFQERWTPPEGLTLTLEYTLVLNPDGSVQQAIPLGHTAENYLDRTGIPLEGESIAPANDPNAPPSRIRLVLEADGEVQTFSEE